MAIGQNTPVATKQNVSLRITDSSQSKPLVFVDGFETDFESSVINPENIQSIDVLKNKMATDQYGEKGKNGVILIKTKKGTEFTYIIDYINLPGGANSSITKIELNGVVLKDMKKLLLDKKSFASTMISSDMKVDENCKVSSVNTLVINTRSISSN
jgi:TonB-dependent SusC/RagA subfamily outer membrane receptor